MQSQAPVTQQDQIKLMGDLLLIQQIAKSKRYRNNKILNIMSKHNEMNPRMYAQILEFAGNRYASTPNFFNRHFKKNDDTSRVFYSAIVASSSDRESQELHNLKIGISTVRQLTANYRFNPAKEFAKQFPQFDKDDTLEIPQAPEYTEEDKAEFFKNLSLLKQILENPSYSKGRFVSCPDGMKYIKTFLEEISLTDAQSLTNEDIENYRKIFFIGAQKELRPEPKFLMFSLRTSPLKRLYNAMYEVYENRDSASLERIAGNVSMLEAGNRLTQ